MTIRGCVYERNRSTHRRIKLSSNIAQQLTPEFSEYLSDLVGRSFDKVAVPDMPSREIDHFRYIISADGTVILITTTLIDFYASYLILSQST